MGSNHSDFSNSYNASALQKVGNLHASILRIEGPHGVGVRGKGHAARCTAFASGTCV